MVIKDGGACACEDAFDGDALAAPIAARTNVVFPKKFGFELHPFVDHVGDASGDKAVVGMIDVGEVEYHLDFHTQFLHTHLGGNFNHGK